MKMRLIISVLLAACVNSGFAADSLYVSGKIQNIVGAIGAKPVAGAIVNILFGSTGMVSDTTDADGNYSIATKSPIGAPNGGLSVYLSVKSPGCYVDTSFMVQIPAPNDGVPDRITQTINLRLSGSCGDSLIITGTVKDSTGTPVGGASVRVYKGYMMWLEATTEGSGTFSITAVNRDTLKSFRVTAVASGYFTKTDTVTFVNVKDGKKDSANVQFLLRKNPNSAVHSSLSQKGLTAYSPSLKRINGRLVLDLGSFFTSAKIGIQDMRGRTVSRAVAVAADKIVLDAGQLKKGTYVVQIDDNAGRSGNFKVVIP